MVSGINLPIVLFDGHCNLCNGTVDFILRFERYPTIRFVALQSAEGEFLSHKLQIPTGEESVVFWGKDGVKMRSAAAFSIASMLIFPFNLLSFFKILPTPISDAAYNLIARNRIGLIWKKKPHVGLKRILNMQPDFLYSANLELEIATLELQKK